MTTPDPDKDNTPDDGSTDVPPVAPAYSTQPPEGLPDAESD
jgi:hypothetical protein